MAEDLTRMRCKEWPKGTPPLDEAKAAELQQQLDGTWERDGSKSLRREFAFPNFRDAYGFTTKVALLAEDEGHHPEIEVTWGRAAITLWTHTAEGLSYNDFIMAAKIDRFA